MTSMLGNQEGQNHQDVRRQRGGLSTRERSTKSGRHRMMVIYHLKRTAWDTIKVRKRKFQVFERSRDSEVNYYWERTRININVHSDRSGHDQLLTVITQNHRLTTALTNSNLSNTKSTDTSQGKSQENKATVDQTRHTIRNKQQDKHQVETMDQDEEITRVGTDTLRYYPNAPAILRRQEKKMYIFPEKYWQLLWLQLMQGLFKEMILEYRTHNTPRDHLELYKEWARDIEAAASALGAHFIPLETEILYHVCITHIRDYSTEAWPVPIDWTAAQGNVATELNEDAWQHTEFHSRFYTRLAAITVVQGNLTTPESIEEYLEVHHIYRDGAINMEEALQSMAEVGVHFVIVEPNNDEDEDDDEDEEDNEDEDDPNPTTAPAA